MQLRNDTIVALSTAPGRSAIAVIRLSGPDAHRIAARLSARWPTSPRVGLLTKLTDPRSAVILDKAVVTRYDAPLSYTGEPMVEISCHGGIAVTTAIMDALIAAGAREADPGEFTRRAVLQGKLDILQAEAVADLVDAQTTAARELALSQLEGRLSTQIVELRRSILHLEALIAYDLDFPEEDDGPIAGPRITGAAERLCADISDLLATVPLAAVAGEGARVVIAGAPNVGKSSLFNALLGVRRAIVTDIPGTTRDAIEARVDNGRWPLRLVDTAGLRETNEVIERLGIEVSERHIGDAHVVLVCSDTSTDLSRMMELVSRVTRASLLPVHTKSDQRSETNGLSHTGSVTVSARTGEGIAVLLDAIAQRLDEILGTVPVDRPVLTRTRHRLALENALAELRLFSDAWTSGRLPAVVAAVHIRSASTALDELIGSVEVEDVLNEVFRNFCVGK